MDMVIEKEKSRLIKFGKEFRKRVLNVKDEKEKDVIRNAMKKEQEQKWKEKETHGYLGKQLEEDPYVHNSLTNNCLTQRLSSYIEGFIMATEEQELDFKETCQRREKDQMKKMNVKCRVCGAKRESVFHVISSCPVLVPTLYLLVRHNQLTRILYQEITGNEKPVYKPPEVTKQGHIEIWYEKEIKTLTKVEKNKPDFLVWNNDNTCQSMEITVHLTPT